MYETEQEYIDALIGALYDYALQHYETWGDLFVECYTREKWLALIKEHGRDEAKLKVEMERLGKLVASYAADIQNS